MYDSANDRIYDGGWNDGMCDGMSVEMNGGWNV